MPVFLPQSHPQCFCHIYYILVPPNVVFSSIVLSSSFSGIFQPIFNSCYCLIIFYLKCYICCLNYPFQFLKSFTCIFFFSNTGGFFLKFPLFPWANYLVVVHLATAILYNCCYIDMSLLCIIPSCYFWQNLRTGTAITFWLILTFELGINF